MAHCLDRFDNQSNFFIWTYTLRSFFRGGTYNKIIKELNLKGNESVLDFGSGLGFLGQKIIKRLNNEGKLTLIDVSSGFMERTQKKLQKYPNIVYLLGDIREKAIPKESFDYIVSTWVMHHIKPEALEETVKILTDSLKPDGKMFIMEMNDPNHRHSFIDHEKIREQFEKAGTESKVLFNKKNDILYEFSKN